MATTTRSRPRPPQRPTRAGTGSGAARARRRRRRTILGVAAAALAVIGTVLGVAVAAGSGSTTDKGGAATTRAAAVVPVAPGDAFQLLRDHAGDPGWVALDVRTPAEFADAHIAGAANLDFDAGDFRSRLAALDKDKSYVVYCHSGNRSGQATALMHDLGFTHVYDVQGGIAAWAQAGLPTTR